MPSECVNGVWRYTGYDDLNAIIQRPVFLPLYKFWVAKPDPYSIITDQPYNQWGNRYEGRVVVDPGAEVPEEYMTNLGPTDIAHWPLYEGGPFPSDRKRGTSQKLPKYKENLAKLREKGPEILGVGAGNCGFETSVDQWLPTCPTREERDKWREAGLQWMLDQIHEVGDLFASMGVQPVWAPMDRMVLLDCYHWGGRMAEAIESYGGWQIIFQEGALFPRWCCIYGNEGQDGRHLDPKLPPGRTAFGEVVGPEHHYEPGYTDFDGRIVEWDERETYPYRKLLRHFWRFNLWHCVGYSAHMKAGFCTLLGHHGCKALVY